jgi:DNA polymerase III delta prime subunit
MEPLLHPSTRKQLLEVAKATQGSYIFYGANGLGRFTTWLWILQSWHGHSSFVASCRSCIQIRAQTYPNLYVIAPEGASIGIAQVHTALHALSLSRHDNKASRLVIIDSAEKLTLEAQNALLKIFEEPPSHTVIGLISNSVEALLPTLRSRAKAITFFKLTPEQVELYLVEKKGADYETAAVISKLTSGCIGAANQLLGSPEELQKHKEAIKNINQLCSPDLFNSLKLAGQLGDSKSISQHLLVEVLQNRFRVQLRQQLAENDLRGVLKTNTALKASLRFQRNLKANVSLKAALGALILELS